MPRPVHLFLFSVCVAFSCNRTPDNMIARDYVPLWDSVSALENPDKGWYHHLHDNGAWRYEIRNDSLFRAFPGMDHLYLRLAWSYLEPEEGVFDWHLIDEVVEKYVPLGYGISFRISCKERRGYPEAVPQVVGGVHYATPHWVRESGAEGRVTLSRGTEDVRAWSPKWDDPVYLEKLDHFHRAFAAKYDGKPWVRYVDVGSIGDYGEGHTNASTRIPPTVEEVKAHMDIYLKNYKQTQIVVTDALLFWNKEQEEARTLYGYAVAHGITLRDDSPMVDWHMRTYTDTWSISHPRFFDPLFREKPTILELQHYSAVKRDGHWLGKNGEKPIPEFGVPGAMFFRKAVETLHATWIGYHGYAGDFLTDNPDLAVELLNRCGYWYFPVSARYPAVFRNGSGHIRITWQNRGVAPAYDRYSLVVCLDDGPGGGMHRILIEDSKNREWMPGEEYPVTYGFKLPSGLEQGVYQLKFKLKELGGETQRDVFVALDRSVMDDQHYIALGKVRVTR